MVQVEVEHRGRLSPEKFDELNDFFKSKGDFLGSKRRFSLIYNTSKENIREVKESLIDLKLRITNGEPEVVLKHGKWSGKDARKEYGFKLERGKFYDFIEFLTILGYHNYVLMANTKYDYEYHGIVFSLVTVPGWGSYFEAEIMADESNVAAADTRLEAELKNLGLKAIDEEEYYDLLNELNNRDGCRIDLAKTNFSLIKSQYLEYFEQA